METRLKERLTGAAILVALIVMLVPEMFRGEGDHEGTSGTTATTGSSGAEGPPLRSYTIDLSNNPKGTPLQSNGEVTTANARADSATADAPKDEPAPRADTPKAEPARSEGSRADNAKVESPKAPAPHEAPARPETATPAASKAAPAAAGRSAAPAASGAPALARPVTAGNASNSSNWSVQLGLFAKRENAERLANELRAKGFTVAITGADPKGLFHVHTAGTSDRASAQALAQRLKGEGFAAAVVAP